MGKREIAHNEQFLLFSQCFLPVWRAFHPFQQIRNSRLQTLLVWESLQFVVWKWVKRNVKNFNMVGSLRVHDSITDEFKEKEAQGTTEYFSWSDCTVAVHLYSRICDRV